MWLIGTKEILKKISIIIKPSSSKEGMRDIGTRFSSWGQSDKIKIDPLESYSQVTVARRSGIKEIMIRFAVLLTAGPAGAFATYHWFERDDYYDFKKSKGK